MKRRTLLLALLAFGLLGGLFAALFMPAIAATLTLPAVPTVSPSSTQIVDLAEPTLSASPGQSATTGSGVTILAQDTFRRPDQAFWGTASGLRTWGGDANNNPAFAIVHNAGQITGGQGVLQATLNVTSSDTELLVSGTASHFDAAGRINLGAVLRWQDTNNWYKAQLDGSNLQLLSNVHGTVTVLATHAFPATGGTNYRLRFRALGSNLFVKAWSSTSAEPPGWTLMQIDTQLTTGLCGIRVKVMPGVVIRMTSFQETSVPAIT